MPCYGYSVTEYARDKPWLVISREHHEVQLDEDVDFAAWAREQHPGAEVQLDPSPQRPWRGTPRA